MKERSGSSRGEWKVEDWGVRWENQRDGRSGMGGVGWVGGGGARGIVGGSRGEF